jgi:hypothetical protein
MFPQPGLGRNRNQSLTLTAGWHETRSFLLKTTAHGNFVSERNRIDWN